VVAIAHGSAALQSRLNALAPDQRTAATAPPGPILCVAPAGSGKTTTLVARAAWLIANGTDPGRLCAVTFNHRAATELEERLASAIAELGHDPAAVRVRTFHSLGREILVDAGVAVDRLVDRAVVLRELAGRDLTAAELRRLDDAFSRFKLNRAPAAEAVLEQPAAEGGLPAFAEPFARYEAHLAANGTLDFDDLLRRSVQLLEQQPALLAGWRARCSQLLVDEVQDLDRTQLHLALLLAAPRNHIFLVGDDDQTIYAWRLADVRRVLGLAAQLPGLRRFDLETNYRCPAPVVQRAVRLVEHNAERFDKRIRSRPVAPGLLVLGPDPGDDVARARRLLTSWTAGDGETRAILARTNAELAPYAAVGLELGVAYRAEDDGLVLDDPIVDRIVGAAKGLQANGRSALPALLEAIAGVDEDAVPSAGPDDEPTANLAHEDADRTKPQAHAVARSVLVWATGLPSIGALQQEIARARVRRNELRRPNATLVLATVHTTKGLEFDHVACVGLDDGRFPNRRSLEEATDPARTLEEERRLAYVAWTRARRSLVLIYDPGAPSPFLREAFSAEELGCTT
jgi:superfamily I DNA/RNA helicase